MTTITITFKIFENTEISFNDSHYALEWKHVYDAIMCQ